MKAKTIIQTIAALALLAISAVSALGSDLKGTAKVGWVVIDDEGNRGVYSPTYNLYEGPAVSFEKFSYRFDNGFRLYGNMKNITLNNRNLTFGAIRPGMFGINFINNQYRRTYDFAGDRFTRRNQTSGDVWFKPVKYVRLFGGYGLTAVNTFDYKQQYYHGGVQLGHDRHYIQLDYRGSKYTDDLSTLEDRCTSRIRVTASTPVLSRTVAPAGSGLRPALRCRAWKRTCYLTADSSISRTRLKIARTR